MVNDFQLAENFNLREFQCKGRSCCNGSVKLESRLVEMLQALRSQLGIPLYITSGYRCKEHNTSVGGAERSQHLLGTAADVRGDIDLSHLMEAAKQIGFTGIGYYPRSRFVHLDVRGGNPVTWEG